MGQAGPIEAVYWTTRGSAVVVYKKKASKKLGQVEYFRAPTPPTPPTPLPDVSTSALLSQVCRARLSQVPALSMDRVVMDLRRQDIERDRILPTHTIEDIFEKHHIPLPSNCIEALHMKFRDEETNGRMSNYEEMMAWLEQERLEGERERGEGDTYVVYQGDNTRIELRRVRGWNGDNEKELIEALASNLGQQEINLESLGNALHKKDYYGKEAISEPQVRTTLRKEGIILDNSLMNLLLKATDLDGRGVHSIEPLLNIIKKSSLRNHRKLFSACRS